MTLLQRASQPDLSPEEKASILKEVASQLVKAGAKKRAELDKVLDRLLGTNLTEVLGDDWRD
jgi:hypothetical protein